MKLLWGGHKKSHEGVIVQVVSGPPHTQKTSKNKIRDCGKLQIAHHDRFWKQSLI